jgi:DNA-binding MarR family transcriptional regulator
MSPKSTNQELIKELTSNGLSKPYVLTFVFLREYGTNHIQKPLKELADDSGITRRTLRHNLYKIDEFGLIEYTQNPGKVNSIYIKKYKH